MRQLHTRRKTKTTSSLSEDLQMTGELKKGFEGDLGEEDSGFRYNSAPQQAGILPADRPKDGRLLGEQEQTFHQRGLS